MADHSAPSPSTLTDADIVSGRKAAPRSLLAATGIGVVAVGRARTDSDADSDTDADVIKNADSSGRDAGLPSGGASTDDSENSETPQSGAKPKTD